MKIDIDDCKNEIKNPILCLIFFNRLIEKIKGKQRKKGNSRVSSCILRIPEKIM
jgi:hypothetical protein